MILLLLCVSTLYAFASTGCARTNVSADAPVLNDVELKSLFTIGNLLAQLPEMKDVLEQQRYGELSRPPSNDQHIISSYERCVCKAAMVLKENLANSSSAVFKATRLWVDPNTQFEHLDLLKLRQLVDTLACESSGRGDWILTDDRGNGYRSYVPVTFCDAHSARAQYARASVLLKRLVKEVNAPVNAPANAPVNSREKNAVAKQFVVMMMIISMSL